MAHLFATAMEASLLARRHARVRFPVVFDQVGLCPVSLRSHLLGFLELRRLACFYLPLDWAPLSSCLIGPCSKHSLKKQNFRWRSPQTHSDNQLQR